MNLHKKIKKTFPVLEELITDKTLSELSIIDENDLKKFNYGLGTIIRLKLLRPKSTLYKIFIQNGFTDKDQMTMEILKEFFKYIQYKAMSKI